MCNTYIISIYLNFSTDGQHKIRRVLSDGVFACDIFILHCVRLERYGIIILQSARFAEKDEVPGTSSVCSPP